MQLGDFTMPLHPPGAAAWSETLDMDIERLATLDELGYAETWLGEHYTSAWENIPAPDLMMARLIPETRNMKLCTGVSCMPSHHPFYLANRIAQLDQMLKGRFMWGVGPCGFPGDIVAAGFDPSQGAYREKARLAIDMVLQLWDDPKPGRYKNEFWDFTITEPMADIGMQFHAKPYQKPHPPVAMAGSRPDSKTLEIAGQRGWIPISINFLPTDGVRQQWDSVEKGAREAGREPPDRATWRVARDVFVADTAKEARKLALEGSMAKAFEGYFLPVMGKVPGRLQQLKIDPNMPDRDVTPEYLVDNIWIVGGPDEVEAKLRKLHHDVGGFGVLVTTGHEWNPKEVWRNSHEMIAKQILPKLSDLD
jgi:alkanesulfonate monooxygenase SsuD/methylene tetrahydromethanopterin reductase-like flavin-dependent oxidoreductase (luciferase family)